MGILWVMVGIAGFVLLAVLLIAYICYRMAFYTSESTKLKNAEKSVPGGKEYAPFRQQMETWVRRAREMPYEEMTVTSFDGLKLTAKYYEYAPGAPIELMFHGYRGTAERDLSGGIARCFRLGHSSFLVNQRSSPGSEGNVISFGINEHKDCMTWLDFMIQHFGPDVKIILCGISMGASTVMMAADKPLPPNVVGILADCGYSSPKEIIKKVMVGMKLPPNLAYPFVELGASLYGHFDLEETSPIEALKNASVPVIFFHGEEDGFVPCEMSRQCYDACTSQKKLVTVPGAGHGLCYSVAPEKYLEALREFFEV